MRKKLRELLLLKFSGYFGIQYKLLTVYLVAMVTVVTLGTTFLYLKTYDLVEQETLSVYQGLVEQIDINIESVLYRVEDSSFRMYTNLEFADIFRRDRMNYPYKQQFKDYYTLIDNYSANRTNRYIKEIRFFFNNEAFYLNLSTSSYPLPEYRNEIWYKKLKEAGTRCWVGYYAPISDERPEVTDYRFSCFYPVKTGKEISGCFELQLNPDYLNKYITDMQKRLNGEIYIISRDGVVLAASDGTSKGALFPYNSMVNDRSSADHRQSYLKLDKSSEYLLLSNKNSNYFVAARINNSIIRSEIHKFIPFAVLTGIVMTAFGLLCCMLLSRNITNRIKELSQFMKDMTLNGTELAPVTGNDEIADLINSYNNMLVTSRTLVHQVYEVNLKKKDMELKLLQAQINPHFLYNTLDSINWMANKRQAADISNMTRLLGQFFRLSLSKGQDIITIKDEIEHVRTYLEIMRLRYEDEIAYDIEVPESILVHKTVKLILQPIIENSIQHGLMEKEIPGGTIRIIGTMDTDCIRIIIEDDGIGMDQDSIDALFTDKGTESRRGFGLKNVNDRIKLSFGDAYGLHITGMKDFGTIVEVKLPIT